MLRSTSSRLVSVSSQFYTKPARHLLTAATGIRLAARSGAQTKFGYSPISSQSWTTLSMFRTASPSSMVRHFSTGAKEKVVKVPGMGDSITEGVIQKWHKNPGEAVKTDDLVASIETDKIVVEIRAPESGVVTQHFAKEGDTVPVGADLFKLDLSAAPAAAAPKAAEKPAAQPTTQAPKTEAPAAPKPAQPTTQPPKTETSTAPKPPTPAPTGVRGETRVRMTKLRARVSQRLKESQNTYAMLTTFNEVDMSNITALRQQYKDEFEKKHGAKLGFMSIFVKAATAALQEQKAINAVIDGDDIVYRDYVDISVAVATPTGLVVPVLRNCDKMGFADVEKNLAELSKKARENKLAIEDMAGGTFTISNGGVYGSMMGTPIINPPQSAILGMHAVKDRAVVVNGQVVVRPIMYVALTYDHRLIDGREAVTFLKKVKELVEDPRRLLLDI